MLKRNLLCIMLLILATTMIYAVTMESTPMLREAPDNSEHLLRPRVRNEAPQYNFAYPPVNLMTTYYDYFPGSYDSVPIRLQPSPVGFFDGGGLYLSFQSTPDAGGIRRVYYNYIQDGSVIDTGLINANAPATTSEGFPNVDIDRNTGNPLFSWHTPSQANPSVLICKFTFDQYDAIGFPGIFSEAIDVLQNPYDVNGEEGNEFIWPTVFIGPSPNEGMQRVYIIGKNHIPNDSDYAVENEMIAFADYADITELSSYDPEQWTHVTIPQLQEWRSMNVRAFRTRIVSREEGIIAIVGHKTLIGEDTPAYSEHDRLFVLENTNYGEGEWNLYTADPSISVENPVNPETDEPYFVGEADNPYIDMRYVPYVNRTNVTIDDEGNYHFVAMYALMTEENTWYPNMTTTKHVKFDRSNQEFIVNDLYPRSEDGSRYLPWGSEPEFNEHGHLVVYSSYPSYWWDVEDLFHENYHRIISDGPYMVALHQESIKARYFNQFMIEDYETWSSSPETYIYISSDYGETWSEPIIMHSNQQANDGNYVPEMQGMIPAYWYISDSIEEISENWARLHMMFLDQNSYGSSVQENSPITGGTIYYTSLDVNFGEREVSVGKDYVTSPEGAMLQSNYPNPFNPTTTIAYSIPEPMNVKLDIFNVRGQIVNTLVDGMVEAGNRYVVWNGTDDTGREVGSGVYFYKLTTENHTETRRMLLVK